MKVGEYVRYKRPFERKETIMIGKIIRIYEPDEKHKIKGYDLDTCDVISDEFSIKSSSNIIDLIEVGDYVNGMKITNKYIDEETGNIELEFNNGSSYLYPKSWNYEARSKKYKIKSIVTHEQFSQREYRIGE